MASCAIGKIDGKGRVLIPQSIRDAANLKQDERVVVDFDSKRQEITIQPAHEKRLLRLGIALSDKPGSLASAASVLSKLGVDLVSTQSHSSHRGEAAVWEVECNPGKRSASEIKSALSKAGANLIFAKWA